MLIFSNSIRVHSLGLVMLYHVKVTAGIDGQGCLARRGARQPRPPFFYTSFHLSLTSWRVFFFFKAKLTLATPAFQQVEFYRT